MPNSSHYLNQCWPGLFTHIYVTHLRWINALRSNDATWWHVFGSTLAQVMACCLMVRSHFLNQGWFFINIMEMYGIHMREISQIWFKIVIHQTSWIITLSNYCLISKDQHIEADTKWQQFHRWYNQMHFQEWKCLNFDWNFIKVWSQGSNWQYSSIVSDDGLAPNRPQAIIWTNDVLCCQYIYASLELMS